jgi:hypothetical protein
LGISIPMRNTAQSQRATLLPQVYQRLDAIRQFLSHLTRPQQLGLALWCYGIQLAHSPSLTRVSLLLAPSATATPTQSVNALLCCKDGWRCGITPAEENTYVREPICPYRKTRLPHRPANTPYLFPPKKPTPLHLPPAHRLRDAQNLPQPHLPRSKKWLLATDQVRQALNLTRVPDHTTLYLTFAKLSQQQWQQLNDTLLEHLRVQEMTVAADTTGLRNGTASV